MGTIRSSTHLTEENGHTILHAMTAPCSVKEISERTGIERHTAEVVSYEKRLIFIVSILLFQYGADYGGRTRYLDLVKVALYQMS